MNFVAIFSLIFFIVAASSQSSYVNTPITSPLSNNELTLNGTTFNGVQYAGAFGFCKTNNNCSPLGPQTYSTCYSQFYYSNSSDPSSPTSQTFQHCSSKAFGDFDTYNMTYFARLYLLELDASMNNFTGSAPECINIFSQVCYMQMWYQNIQNGFICNNTGAVFAGKPLFPPCRWYCHYLFQKSGCTTLHSAFVRQGLTELQYCELFPLTNCFSSGYFLSPSYSLLASILVFILVFFRRME